MPDTLPSRIEKLSGRIAKALGHAPGKDQLRACHAMSRWLLSDVPRRTLILRGYAGTGKTALLGALARVLRADKRAHHLLAPTGRAAKVLAASAGARGATIHSHIYRVKESAAGTRLERVPNEDPDTVFIVDEASMLSTATNGNSAFGDHDLLADLIDHVFEAPGCCLLFIGDPAQLPPVGSSLSPALEKTVLAERYGLKVGMVRLTEVMRQAEGSGVLMNATRMRELIGTDGPFVPHFSIDGYEDIDRVLGTDLEDHVNDAYANEGIDETVIICRSNKQVDGYARHVRAKILGFEEELCAGDRLMVVRNDTFWDRSKGAPQLIANGEMVRVERVHAEMEAYGSRFARLTIALQDGEKERELEVFVLLDLLGSGLPSLPRAEQDRLFNNAMLAAEGKSRREKVRAVKQDPLFQALHVKYAYAVTCHKAQGGQWEHVFVDQGYITDEMMDREYLRWMYTAITRTRSKLHLVNFPDQFFEPVERIN